MGKIENTIPILRVEDAAASLRFYCDLLGFRLDWEAPGTSSVSADGHSLMLAERGQGQPGTWVWIGVEDADTVFARLVASGAKVRNPPTNYPWAWELQIEDPDGHVLRFGGEPKDAPFETWRG